MKTSGIGGQAVIEGIMMRNKDKYSIAVRKPDDDIEILVKDSKPLSDKYPCLKWPIIRGVVSFADSLVTGISTLTYSASFYDDPAEQEKTKVDELGKAVFKDKLESILMAVTVIISVFIAVGLFMVLPYFISRLMVNFISSQVLLNFIEGVVRVTLFIIYLAVISCTKDISRTFMYHGAEHKCINCIEHGKNLTLENVMRSSRIHRRCGTSFMFLVMFVSMVFFIFIKVDNTVLQVVIRILLMPVIAGVSYEFIRAAGRNENNVFLNIVSMPGLLLQKLTTKEPDKKMVEVAIAAVEAVFDWKEFLMEYHKNDPDFIIEESSPEDFIDKKTKKKKKSEANNKPGRAKRQEEEEFVVASSYDYEDDDYVDSLNVDAEEAQEMAMASETYNEDVAAAVAEEDDSFDGFEFEDDYEIYEEEDESSDVNAEQESVEEQRARIAEQLAAVNEGMTEEASSSENELYDDGIEFAEDNDAEDVVTADEVPVFKKREKKKK